MKIYISGKISGLDPEEVDKKFKRVQTGLENGGFEAVNPVSVFPQGIPLSWEEYMVSDIEMLFNCDAVYMLSDWEESRGARIEHFIAKECGKTMFYEKTNKPANTCKCGSGKRGHHEIGCIECQ